jgi:hypothetical protein
VRLAGDLIYTSLPQLSLGVQYKNNKDFLVPSAVGAIKDSGTDINFTASKLLLDGVLGRNLLLNANLRYTKANQTGLVGFGGDKNESAELRPEVSAAVLLNKYWLVGSEYRAKPDNLSAIKEDDWQTIFVGWFPSKKLALIAAYVDLGEVATFKDQTGWYLSLQGDFLKMPGQWLKIGITTLIAFSLFACAVPPQPEKNLYQELGESAGIEEKVH